MREVTLLGFLSSTMMPIKAWVMVHGCSGMIMDQKMMKLLSMSLIVKKAFKELYPNKSLPELKLRYSRAFKAYNANVRHSREFLHFRLSYEWKSVSQEIQMGLIQSLLNKIYKTDIRENIPIIHNIMSWFNLENISRRHRVCN